MSPGSCAGCGALLAPAARFCGGCGRPVDRPAARRPERLPWLVAGGALAGTLALLLAMVMGDTRPAPAPLTGRATAAPPAGTPPDISRLTPRERFDRLYARVMQAATAGDEATAARFSPMALAAYEMLDTVDADARYHAALLRMHGGEAGSARPLGDSILGQNPRHLLGYVVLGTSARWLKDDSALTRVYRDFLASYDAEIRTQRPEYAEHRRSIEEFRRAAEEARAAGS